MTAPVECWLCHAERPRGGLSVFELSDGACGRVKRVLCVNAQACLERMRTGVPAEPT